MKRILVPTDFSDCANSASEVAMLLAKKSGAELYFLHLAVDPSGPAHFPGKSGALTEAAIGQARFKLGQLVSAAKVNGVIAKPELILGNGQERIQDYIEPYGIDWLVMGSHGATGIRDRIIGSKTQHVIRNIKIPSLVVKHKPANSELKNIVFASTFKEETSHALHLVVNFTKLWDSNLHLLFINLFNHLIEDKVARLMMTKLIERFTGMHFTLNITETNDKEFGIAQFSKTINADLIAVAMENKNMLGRLLSPSLAEQLINHSQLPILIVHPEIITS